MEPAWTKALDQLAEQMDMSAERLAEGDLAMAAELFAKMIRCHDLLDEPDDIARYITDKHG